MVVSVVVVFLHSLLSSFSQFDILLSALVVPRQIRWRLFIYIYILYILSSVVGFLTMTYMFICVCSIRICSCHVCTTMVISQSPCTPQACMFTLVVARLYIYVVCVCVCVWISHLSAPPLIPFKCIFEWGMTLCSPLSPSCSMSNCYNTTLYLMSVCVASPFSGTCLYPAIYSEEI